MPNFVILDPRTASLPTRPVAPATPARPATVAGGEGTAKERFAPDGSAAAQRTRTPASSQHATQQHPSDPTKSDIAESRASGPFTAQRLAQEAERAADTRTIRPAAMAAYLKARDSHIQILPSIQAVDLRI